MFVVYGERAGAKDAGVFRYSRSLDQAGAVAEYGRAKGELSRGGYRLLAEWPDGQSWRAWLQGLMDQGGPAQVLAQYVAGAQGVRRASLWYKADADDVAVLMLYECGGE